MVNKVAFSSPSDQNLLLAVAEGNVQAFETLMLRHEQKVFKFILTLLKSSELAEEITQDVFLKIWENRSALAELDSFTAWLFKVSRNQTLNAIKQIAARYEREESYANMSDQTFDGNDVIHRKELASSIETCLEALPPKRRAIMRLKLEGFSNNEIGLRLGISPNTVKNQLAKAYLKFREQMSHNISLLLVGLLYHQVPAYLLTAG